MTWLGGGCFINAVQPQVKVSGRREVEGPPANCVEAYGFYRFLKSIKALPSPEINQGVFGNVVAFGLFSLGIGMPSDFRTLPTICTWI